jgi:hypothetical protein
MPGHPDDRKLKSPDVIDMLSFLELTLLVPPMSGSARRWRASRIYSAKSSCA